MTFARLARLLIFSARTVVFRSVLSPYCGARLMALSYVLTALAAAALLIAPAPAGAAQAASDTVCLNLRQALERAMAANLDLREAQLELDRAFTDQFEADMSRWLSVVKVDFLTSVVKDAEGGIDSLGRIESMQTSWDNFGPYWQLDIDVGQPIATFGRISASRRAAGFGVEAGRAGLEVRRAEVAAEVYRLYYGILLARELLRILDDVTDKIEIARERVLKLLAEGSTEVSHSDRAKMDVYAFEIERKRFEAEKGINLALAALRRATGIPYDTPLEIEQGRLRPVPDEVPPLDSLQSEALENRAELAQVEAGVEARRLQVDAAVAERYPIIYVGGRFRYYGAPGRDLNYDTPWIGDSYNRFTGGIGFGLKYSLDLAGTEADIQRARIAYREMVRKRAWARASIALDVEKAHLEAREARNNGQLGARSLRAGRALMIQTWELYEVGVASTRDLIEAYGTYAKSQNDYYQSLYDQYLALAELYRAIGRPIWRAGQSLDPPQE